MRISDWSSDVCSSDLLDMRAVDHLGLVRSAAGSQRAEQPLPDTALGPADEPVVDRRRRAVFRRTILPAAAALQNMQDTADDPTIIRPRLDRKSTRLHSSH